MVEAQGILLCLVLTTSTYVHVRNTSYIHTLPHFLELHYLIKSNFAFTKQLTNLLSLDVTPHITLHTHSHPQSHYHSLPLQVPIINPRRACAARVTVLGVCVCLSVCLFVCLSVDDYSRTTGYEAAYERYQQLQCYKGMKNNVAILLKRLRSRDMA